MIFAQEPTFHRLEFLAFLFRLKLVKDPMYQLACTHAVNLYYQPLT